jgi:hypothetical protein
LAQATASKQDQLMTLGNRYSDAGMKLTEDGYKLSKALNEAGVSITDA